MAEVCVLPQVEAAVGCRLAVPEATGSPADQALNVQRPIALRPPSLQMLVTVRQMGDTSFKNPGKG